MNDKVLQEQVEKEMAVSTDIKNLRLAGDHQGGPTQTGAWMNLTEYFY